jgi:HSP20 family protein
MTIHTPSKDIVTRFQRSAFDAFAPLQREMNRFIHDVGEGWDAFAAVGFAPHFDIADTKTGFEVYVELPGVALDDVKITFEDNTLTIAGEKKAEYERADYNFYVVERGYGQFFRSVLLPQSVDGTKITATMKDGVLKIFAPKRAGAETRKIEVLPA